MATLEQIEQALRAADAAGNTEDARRLAQAYADMRGQQAQTPRRNVRGGASMAGSLGTANVAGRNVAEPPKGNRVTRFLGDIGGRNVLQGAYGLYGSLGGDALNEYVLAPADKAIGWGNQLGVGDRTYRQAASDFADELGMAKPQTPGQRVVADIGEGLTGTGLTLGLGGLLARGAQGAQTAAPTIRSKIGDFLTAQPGLQAVSTATGTGAASTTREAGGGQGAQLAAGLIGATTPSVMRIGIPEAAGGVLSRSVPEQRREIARQAQEMGIELSPAQLSDSRFMKWAQSMLRSVPFTGAQGRYQQQVGQFNRQLARTIGQDADAITPEVYDAARAAQSRQFDDLTGRNALRVDDSLIKKLSQISNGASISPEIKKLVDGAIDRFYSQATTGPGGVVVPGAAYQAIDSELNGIIKSGGPTAYHLGMVQGAIRSAMDKSITPRDAQAWQQLRREYGARKTLAPLVAKADSGAIPPAQVMGAATNTKVSKEAMASGRRGRIGDLARIGQLLKEPPSSGTAERTFVGGLFGAGTYVDPVTGTLVASGLNLLSRGLDSRELARLMVKKNPGMTMEVAEKIIARSVAPASISTQPVGREPDGE